MKRFVLTAALTAFATTLVLAQAGKEHDPDKMVQGGGKLPAGWQARLDSANAKFEGVIPEGEYGGGTVMVWDYGTYEPENNENVSEALRKGELKFTLNGEKLKGSWVLVRTRDRQWLLIKHRDYYTTEEEVTELAPVSILTRRSLAEIAEDEGGNPKKAATGDPKKIPRRTGVKRRKKGQRAKVWHSS